jgi:transposase
MTWNAQQLELALKDLLIAAAESDADPVDQGQTEDAPAAATDDMADRPTRRRPRVSDATPRERQELDPGSCCPDCGGDLQLVGEDASEMLDLIAAQLKVVQIARLKKSCRRCERKVQMPAPSRPIPGSMAGAGLLAHILVAKFDDHLPLYRQHEIFARMGADIPDSTLVDWCGRAMKVLKPLIERIEADVMASDLLHADCEPSRRHAFEADGKPDPGAGAVLAGQGPRQGREEGTDLDLCPRVSHCLPLVRRQWRTPLGRRRAARRGLYLRARLEGGPRPPPSGQDPRHPAGGRLQGLCHAL